MTSLTLRRQIERAKSELDEIKPKQPASIKLLNEPDPAMGGDSLLDFLLEVREAKKTHDLVFVACFQWNDERVGHTFEGVRYFESDFSALLAKAVWNGERKADLGMLMTGDICMPGPLGIIPFGANNPHKISK